MKFLLPLFLACMLLIGTSVSAQNEEIETLLAEREQLMKQYDHFNSQKSNFWGKQSKKDLMNVIDVLKEIIRNDTKLITAYKAEELRKTATLTAQNKQLNQQVKSDRGMIDESIYSLQDQIKNLQNKLKLRDQKFAELQDELKDVKAGSNRSDQYLFVTGLMLLASLGYNFYRGRSRNTRSKSRR